MRWYRLRCISKNKGEPLAKLPEGPTLVMAEQSDSVHIVPKYGMRKCFAVSRGGKIFKSGILQEARACKGFVALTRLRQQKDNAKRE